MAYLPSQNPADGDFSASPGRRGRNRARNRAGWVAGRQHAQLRRDHPTLPAPTAPQRWAAAVAALVDLQDEYRVWFDDLPASLEDSRLAEKLQTIAELDLDELQSIDPPRGYGCD